MQYQHEKGVSRTWITPERYYTAEVNQTLFGDWQCERRWGSRTSRRGNSMTIVAHNYQAALTLLDATTKRRQSRGYVLN